MALALELPHPQPACFAQLESTTQEQGQCHQGTAHPAQLEHMARVLELPHPQAACFAWQGPTSLGPGLCLAFLVWLERTPAQRGLPCAAHAPLAHTVQAQGGPPVSSVWRGVTRLALGHLGVPSARPEHTALDQV